MVLGKKPNYLIVKDDVGKPKPSTRKLPKEDFVFGKADQTGAEGAGSICTTWKYHETKPENPSKNPRNFMKLNKNAAKAGQVTSKDVMDFRKTNDVRMSFGQSALIKKQRGISLPTEGFTYGRANRPQTPVQGIIAGSFGEQAGALLQTRYVQMQTDK